VWRLQARLVHAVSGTWLAEHPTHRHPLLAAGGNTTSGLYLGGMGVDPRFIVVSPLYSPALANATDDWYNTSAAAGEVSPTGFPFGFFHAPMPGGWADHLQCSAVLTTGWVEG
jgi:hypothetical protein